MQVFSDIYDFSLASNRYHLFKRKKHQLCCSLVVFVDVIQKRAVKHSEKELEIFHFRNKGSVIKIYLRKIEEKENL